MAKPSWLTLSPASGSGNSTIVNTGSVHTGRLLRTGTVSVQGVGVSGASVYTVNQSPKSEFVSFNDGDNISSPKAGGALTIKGKTNSTKLTFSLATGGTIVVSLPASYSANGVSTNNAAIITGDPGATAEFEFSIVLTIPANTTITPKTKDLICTPASGTPIQIAIEQAAGDATLSVSPTTITLSAAGTAMNVTVTSNTTWTAS